MPFATLFRRNTCSLDFDQATLPWVDLPSFERHLAKRTLCGEVSEENARLLQQWNRDGYILLKNAIEPQLIDALLRDYERAWKERPLCNVLIEDKGVMQLCDAPPRESLTHHHYRCMDFHNLSEAAGHIALHPAILEYVRLIFDDTPVAMQSLLFEYGSEQHAHQDFAFVHADILSHLIGVWIACEPSGKENGGLLYYPGSHKIDKFDFGGGMLHYDGSHPEKLEQFETYLAEECERQGLQPKILEVEAGDVLLWHAALVHGGTQAIDSQATRKSFVVHYSSEHAYPRDRRNPHSTPIPIERHDGMYYAWDAEGHVEGRYRL